MGLSREKSGNKARYRNFKVGVSLMLPTDGPERNYFSGCFTTSVMLFVRLMCSEIGLWEMEALLCEIMSMPDIN